jgi:transcriptional regulator with XRE-family HTH domain
VPELVSKRGGAVLDAPKRRRRGDCMVSLDESKFAERLNRLFDTVQPPGRGPYRDSDVVQTLARRGLMLSGPYLSQLRRGARTNPSIDTVEMIAEFFGVHTDYFTDAGEAYRRRVDEELYWRGLSRDPDVGSLVTALTDLPPETRDRLLSEAEARASAAAMAQPALARPG